MRTTPVRRAAAVAAAGALAGGAVAVAPAASSATGRAAALPATTVAGCPAPSTGVHHYAPGSGKTVALTFDDGPSAQTRRLLSILRSYGVRATFFDLGRYVDSRPGTVRAQRADGHTVGNHSYGHDSLRGLTAARQASEIDGGTAALVAATGAAPCFFRPPYGDYDATTLSLAYARGMTVYNWSVDTEDWKAAGTYSSYWVDRIVARTEAGGSLSHPLILMHDQQAGTPSTLAALPTVIRYYRSRGYRFVDLLGRTGLTPALPTGEPGSTIAYTRAGLHAFRRGSDGVLYGRVRRDFVWGPWRPLGGSLATAPAAVATSRTSVLVVAGGRAGQVQARQVNDDGTGGWSDLGGPATLRPAVTAGAAGAVTVVTRGPRGGLWVRRYVDGSWGDWRWRSGSFATGPAAATAADGAVTLVAADSSGRVWQRWSGAGGTDWSAWARTIRTTSANPALTATPDGTHLLLVYRGGDGAIYSLTRQADGTGWGTRQRLDGIFATGPSVTLRGDVAEVVAGGLDGRLRIASARFTDGTPSWSGWRTVPAG